MKLYRLRVHNSILHLLSIVLCVHYPKLSLIPLPFIPLFTLFYLPRPPFPLCLYFDYQVGKGIFAQREGKEWTRRGKVDNSRHFFVFTSEVFWDRLWPQKKVVECFAANKCENPEAQCGCPQPSLGHTPEVPESQLPLTEMHQD